MEKRTNTSKWPALLTGAGVVLVVVAVAVFATTWATSGRDSQALPPNSPAPGGTTGASTSPDGTPDPSPTIGPTTSPSPTAPSDQAGPPTNPPTAINPPSPPEQTCATLTGLKFCDDFTGPAGSPPDSSKWRILTGSSWGGQCFRNDRENISLNGQGQLQLTLVDKGTTQCTDGRGYETTVTSGGMDTKGKVYFKYGRFEIRAKLSCAKSVWGAIWMATGSGPEWPKSGEIDFYELFNNKQETIKHTIHAGDPYWNTGATYTFPALRLTS